MFLSPLVYKAIIIEEEVMNLTRRQGRVGRVGEVRRKEKLCKYNTHVYNSYKNRKLKQIGLKKEQHPKL